MVVIIGSLSLAFFIAWVGTPLVKRLAICINATDKPEERKVHCRMMPRLGGLAICVSFWLTVLLTQNLTIEIWGLLAGGLVICLLGILDDVWGVSPKLKLLGQVIAACIVMASGIRVEFLTNPAANILSLGLFSYPLTILWIIGVTNAVNLIDGLDGLAAGVSAIAAVTLGVVSVMEGFPSLAMLAFLLAASTLGFLKYNFHPAQIFMGDTGSLFLGFNLSALAILSLTKSTTVIALFLPVVILGIPIFDTLLAIFRRYHNRKPIFSPDKEHLHHRLLDMGLTHRKAVLSIYGVSIILGLSAIFMTIVTTAQGMLIMVMTSMGALILANKVGILELNKKLVGKKTCRSISKQAAKS